MSGIAADETCRFVGKYDFGHRQLYGRLTEKQENNHHEAPDYKI